MVVRRFLPINDCPCYSTAGSFASGSRRQGRPSIETMLELFRIGRFAVKKPGLIVEDPVKKPVLIVVGPNDIIPDSNHVSCQAPGCLWSTRGGPKVTRRHKSCPMEGDASPLWARLKDETRGSSSKIVKITEIVKFHPNNRVDSMQSEKWEFIPV